MFEYMEDAEEVSKELADIYAKASRQLNYRIDEIYDKAVKAGASGGKLLGAGGAGFMLFYVSSDKQQLVRQALSKLREIDFEIDNSGSSIVMTDRDFI